VKQHKRKKKGTKLDIKILKPSSQQEVLYVAACGGGIKKNTLPLWHLKLTLFHAHFLKGNGSKLFVLNEQGKFGDIFIQKVSMKES
jgi:hypothetical protein